MIYSKHRRIAPHRRFGGRDFQSKIKKAQSYKRLHKPIDLTRKSKWLVILGFRSNFFRIIWVGIIAALAYFFIFSDYLVVNDVSVSGNNRVSPDQVREVILALGESRTAFIPKSNFFLLTRSQAADHLSSNLPFVKEVKNYKRTWPNKVSFEVVERDPGFVIQVGDKRYLVDDEGVVVNDSAQTLGLPLVIDQVAENFDTGKPMDNTKLVAFIISVNKQWSSRINTPIKELRMPGKAATEVQVVTEEGWGVFFDISRSSSFQLGNLNLILSREIPAKDRGKLSYIDLRLEKWAYYCFKDTPCVAGTEIDNSQAQQAQQGPPLPTSQTSP